MTQRTNNTSRAIPEKWATSQWHPDVHRAWHNQVLAYWFFGFTDTRFSQEDIRRGLIATLKEQQITSYVCYELIGQYDLLLRTWISPNDINRLRDALKARLKWNEILYFQVREVVRHWVWGGGMNGAGPIKRPRQSVLTEQLPGRKIDMLDSRATRSVPMELRQEARTKRLLAPAETKQGIKLVILIRSPEDFKESQLEDLKNGLARLLDRSGAVVRERSLYFGEGHNTQFVIMCRAPYGKFHQVRPRLLEKITKEFGAVQVRSTTLPATLPRFLAFSDQLPGSEVAVKSAPSLIQMLKDGEGPQFEVKGSVYADLDPWVAGGKIKTPQNFVEIVLKSICGLLNATGGTLLIGLLELGKYPEGTRGREFLAKQPRIGTYACIGLRDPAFAKNPDAPEQHWDDFYLKLEQDLHRRIDPDPGYRVKIRLRTLKGRPVCVVTVKDDVYDTEGFYLNKVKFLNNKNPNVLHVRRGPLTESLEGQKAERHLKWRRERRMKKEQS